MFGLDHCLAFVLGRHDAPCSWSRSRSCSASATPRDPDHLAAVTTLIASAGAAGARRRPLGLPGAPATRLRSSPSACRSSSTAHISRRRCSGPRRRRRLSHRRARRLAAHPLAPRRVPRNAPITATGRTPTCTRTRRAPPHARSRRRSVHSPIGLLHGMGGSAGVGLLLVARSRDSARDRSARDPRRVHRGLDDAAPAGFGLTLGRRFVRPPRTCARPGEPRVRALVRAGRPESRCRTISSRTGSAARANTTKPR